MRAPSPYLRLLTGVAALALAGCSAERPAAHATAETNAPPAAATADTSAPVIRLATAEDVLAAVREPGAQVVLVNLWATWCMPCRHEFPDLMRVTQAYRSRGLRTILVSADFDDQRSEVTQFLREQGVTFPSYLKTGSDMEFLNTLEPKLTGALPATLVYDGQGRLVAFWEGGTDYHGFETAVLKALQSRPTSS